LDLKDRLSQAYHLATEAAQKAREQQKEGYDIRIRGAVIKPGDRVLVKVVSFDGKHKLADRWEQDRGLLSNFLGAGVGTSLMYPIGNNKLRWSVLAHPSLFSLRRL
jgi:hypothetical protein